VKASATRHLEAADALFHNKEGSRYPHRAVAGYLYGIAGENALKEIMRDSGIRPLPKEQKRDDPYYAHFPVLKTLLRDQNHGRRAGELKKYAEDGALMSEWDIDMRYAPGKDINAKWIENWQRDARRLVGAMGGG
jgi:hypothetical protein